MTTSIIDTSLHTSSFPTTYVGPGTLIGNTQQSGGIVNKVNGYFTSNGNAVQVNNGFTPTHIKAVNTTDAITWEWQLGMPAADSVKTVLGGSLASTLDTGSAFTISVDPAGNEVVTLSSTLCGSAKNICFEIVG